VTIAVVVAGKTLPRQAERIFYSNHLQRRAIDAWYCSGLPLAARLHCGAPGWSRCCPGKTAAVINQSLTKLVPILN
jgi:hypothetical protein